MLYCTYLSRHIFGILPPLTVCFALLSTVEHLLIVVHQDLYAVLSVGMADGVTAAHLWAVICVGDTPPDHRFADTGSY